MYFETRMNYAGWGTRMKKKISNMVLENTNITSAVFAYCLTLRI